MPRENRRPKLLSLPGGLEYALGMLHPHVVKIYGKAADMAGGSILGSTSKGEDNMSQHPNKPRAAV